MSEIEFTEIVEEEFGEKVYMESPYSAKGFINALPWGEDDNYDESRLEEEDDVPDFTFPEGFAAHQKWSPEQSVWKFDAEAVPVLTEYFEAAGFDVDASNVQMQQSL
jgi:hypothetical protein